MFRLERQDKTEALPQVKSQFVQNLQTEHSEIIRLQILDK